MTWTPSSQSADAFVGGGLTALVGDGRGAVAFGWDLDTDAPLVWKREEGGWRRNALPSAFEGIPRIAASGTNGTVVVGYRPSLRAGNPIFWHETADGSWAPEATPVIATLPDPTTAECETGATNPLALLFVDRAIAIACQGGEPLTFRAWAEGCSDCGFGSPISAGPSWLLNGRHTLMISLGPGMGWSQSTVLDPALVESDAVGSGMQAGWVEVTGHFDDPRAASCEWTPSSSEYSFYSGRATSILSCRQQFVVTDVATVDGP